MSSTGRVERWYGEGLITAVSVGMFLILVGVFVVTIPNLPNDIVNLANDINTTSIAGTSIMAPAPTMPGAHVAVYNAAAQFELAIGVLQVVILGLRLLFRSRIRRVTETVGGVVFWFGTSYLTSTYLNSSTTTTTWFEFWAVEIILVGLSFMVRGLAGFAARKMVK